MANFESHPAPEKLTKEQLERIKRNLGVEDESVLIGLEPYLDKFDFDYDDLAISEKKELEFIKKHLRLSSEVDALEADDSE
jgi:hypothetical protein